MQQQKDKQQKKQVSCTSSNFKTLGFKGYCQVSEIITERNFLQTMYLLRHMFPEYIKSCYNSTIGRQTIQLKIWQNVEEIFHQRNKTCT